MDSIISLWTISIAEAFIFNQSVSILLFEGEGNYTLILTSLLSAYFPFHSWIILLDAKLIFVLSCHHCFIK